MMLELHPGMPHPQQLERLLTSAGAPAFPYGSALSAGPVMSAYEEGELVGFGFRVNPSDGTASEIVVAPGFEQRDVERYLRRLLEPPVSPAVGHSMNRAVQA